MTYTTIPSGCDLRPATCDLLTNVEPRSAITNGIYAPKSLHRTRMHGRIAKRSN